MLVDRKILIPNYHHRILIAFLFETGGSNGIRDEGLLDSALNLPFQSFDGQAIYN